MVALTMADPEVAIEGLRHISTEFKADSFE